MFVNNVGWGSIILGQYPRRDLVRGSEIETVREREGKRGSERNSERNGEKGKETERKREVRKKEKERQ